MKLIHTETTEQSFYLSARKLQVYLLFSKALKGSTDTCRPTLSMYVGSRKFNITMVESEGKSNELPQVAEEHLHSGTNSILRHVGYSIFKSVHLLS